MVRFAFVLVGAAQLAPSHTIPEYVRCARHAVQALNGITGLRVDWDDSRGLDEYERSAIELAEERSCLAERQAA